MAGDLVRQPKVLQSLSQVEIIMRGVSSSPILMNSDLEVGIGPLSDRPLVHDLGEDQVNQHVPIKLMVNIVVLPFDSSCRSVLAVSLRCGVGANGPNAYLAIPLGVGVRVPARTSLCTQEHYLANVACVLDVSLRRLFIRTE
jgi:hypothetical protein